MSIEEKMRYSGIRSCKTSECDTSDRSKINMETNICGMVHSALAMLWSLHQGLGANGDYL